MRAPSHERPHWALVPSALLAVLVAAGACGGALGPVKSNSSPQPNPAAARITTVRASAQVKSDAPTTRVSVSCPGDAQMIGGGFVATDVFEYDARMTASYPDPHDSDLRTWTAIAGPSAAFTLSVEAYCLSQEPDLQISLHIASSGAATCPLNFAALGSGFNGGASYLLCAGRSASISVKGAPVSFNPHSSSHSYYPGSVTLSCPSGALALGGDISAGGGALLASYSAGQPFLGWIVTIGGDAATTASATCVTIAA